MGAGWFNSVKRSCIDQRSTKWARRGGLYIQFVHKIKFKMQSLDPVSLIVSISGCDLPIVYH